MTNRLFSSLCPSSGCRRCGFAGAAPGATQYIVSQNIDGTWTRLGVTDAPEYTVTGLDQGEYQFRVRPFAEVEGVNYYSTKNSPVVTVTLDASALRFSLCPGITEEEINYVVERVKAHWAMLSKFVRR